MRFAGTRITLRLQRFELVAFGIALGALAILTFLGALYLGTLSPGPGCLPSFDGSFAAGCEGAYQAFSDAQQVIGGILLGPLFLVTYTVGLFLGVPIVGRELERGTVRLAWSLSPSRWGWFSVRLLPILAVVIGLTVVTGIATERWFATSTLGSDMANSFEGYGSRGLLLASRAIFIFAVAVAVGALVGRTLPSVILAALVAGVGLTGGMSIHQQVLTAEAIAIPADESGGIRPADMFFDQKFVLPDGTLVGWQSFEDQPNGPYDEFGNLLYPMVSIVVPGERYQFVSMRESLVLAGGSLVGLLLAGFVVSRRRPG